MTPEQMNTRFGLMRHAPTVWNRDKRIQGHKDSPLTGEGNDLCRDWGRVLELIHWNRILTSDLGRARVTAEKINTRLGVPIVQSPSLREMDWGDWTGKTIQQIKNETPGMLQQMESRGWHFRPPGGEDRLTVWERCRWILQETAGKWPGETILVVAHEGVIKCLIYALDQRKFMPDEPAILRSGWLHWLESSGDSLRIDRLNAVSLGKP